MALEVDGGVNFDLKGLQIEAIRDEVADGGSRLHTTATLAGAAACSESASQSRSPRLLRGKLAGAGFPGYSGLDMLRTVLYISLPFRSCDA